MLYTTGKSVNWMHYDHSKGGAVHARAFLVMELDAKGEAFVRSGRGAVVVMNSCLHDDISTQTLNLTVNEMRALHGVLGDVIKDIEETQKDYERNPGEWEDAEEDA